MWVLYFYYNIKLKEISLFSYLDISSTTMMKMTDFSILMLIRGLLRLHRSLIEKKLHGTTSQLLPQKMVNDLTLCIIGTYVPFYTRRFILRFSHKQVFYQFYFSCWDLRECTECIRYNFTHCQIQWINHLPFPLL